MFRKRIKKQDYVENRATYSNKEKKRNLKFSIKFNKRLSKKLELHSLRFVKLTRCEQKRNRMLLLLLLLL